MQCNHKMVYEGAVNLVINGEVDGTVDVWRCRICGKASADVRRVGEPKLPERVGMGDLAELSRWGVIVCRDRGETEIHIALSQSTMRHNCRVFGSCEIAVDERGELKCTENHGHKFYFISEKLNSSLVIG